MTSSKNPLNSAHENFAQEESLSHSLASDSAINLTSASKNQSRSKASITSQTPAKFKSRRTLRNQLLITVLPTVLLPLAVASFVAINSTQRQAKEILKEQAQETIRIASEVTRKSIEDAFRVTDLLEINPLIIDALYSAYQTTQAQKLPEKSTKELEKIYGNDRKTLVERSVVAQINQYLEALAAKENVDQIIFTERNGYSLAHTSKTPEFVQRDKSWWNSVANDDQRIIEPEFDPYSNRTFVKLIRSLKDPISENFLGVTTVTKSIEQLNEGIFYYLKVKLSGSQQVQIIAASSGTTLSTFNSEGAQALGEITGGEPLLEAIRLFKQVVSDAPEDPENILSQLQGKNGISNVTTGKTGTDEIILSLELQETIFYLLNVPGSDLVVVTSVKQSDIAQAGRQLALNLALIALVLGILATLLVLLLAEQLSKPLKNLTDKAQEVAEGNLDAQVELEGTLETFTLGDSFNNLVKQVNNLITEQKNLATERQQQKENLEKDIYQLFEEVEGALEGDLTVKASLNSLEMSTVADLFNAIIDNLKDMAIQVKKSTNQVGSSLVENEQSIQILTQQAIQEAKATHKTLDSVEQMSESIKVVAQNANEAATLALDAFNETKEGTKVMDDTVDSIVSLRTTVGETAKKMKRLGESSQKISQVVSLIEEIALKTNLLAINASVEASRAGEQGQGFTVVAEQVGALAQQSATATKEIARIVSNIQLETQEVTKAMDLGTSQVVDSTRLVESTKKHLETVLERSQSINELMQSISQATVTQTDTSALVTELMQEIARYSEQRLKSSQEVSESMRATAQVAKDLESAVEQFKVEQEETV